MDESVCFTATCPKCRHQRPQEGFTRRALLTSLRAGRLIEAYCVACEELWPIAAPERALLARELFATDERAMPVSSDNARQTERAHQ
jgi:hypothetical protein